MKKIQNAQIKNCWLPFPFRRLVLIVHPLVPSSLFSHSSPFSPICSASFTPTHFFQPIYEWSWIKGIGSDCDPGLFEWPSSHRFESSSHHSVSTSSGTLQFLMSFFTFHRCTQQSSNRPWSLHHSQFAMSASWIPLSSCWAKLISTSPILQLHHTKWFFRLLTHMGLLFSIMSPPKSKEKRRNSKRIEDFFFCRWPTKERSKPNANHTIRWRIWWCGG
jgi:hypothetical protein